MALVSSEVLSQNWYTGKDRSMLPTNYSEWGSAAILMTSRDQEKEESAEADNENNVGVSISKNTTNVAEALKANMVLLCPMVLPLTEQFRYGLSLVLQKMKILDKKSIYIPDFRKGFEHSCTQISKMTLHRFGNTSSSTWYEPS
ncbi:unnamed protein product [Fraxinus pennsylvanica]|uniref:FAE domain-containing protein n=1 Tax=Fraxinus pennsylvanica TaxID=56036 RepID=A0AAD1ZVE8_9LAMI|nr:unnamed protein product [Fraxinus pennsylvanica]